MQSRACECVAACRSVRARRGLACGVKSVLVVLHAVLQMVIVGSK